MAKRLRQIHEWASQVQCAGGLQCGPPNRSVEWKCLDNPWEVSARRRFCWRTEISYIAAEPRRDHLGGAEVGGEQRHRPGEICCNESYQAWLKDYRIASPVCFEWTRHY